MSKSSLKSKLTQTLKNRKGFTLIELLVVIGILAVLLAIVLVAINPARQFEQANNTKRSSDVNTILNAIHQYAAGNQGNLPPGLAEADADTAVAISGAGAGEDFCNAIVPTYVAALPTDPSLNSDPIETCDATYTTGYSASKSSTDNRITVSADNNAEIEVVR